MKPTSIIAFVLMLLTVAAHAQTLGEFKPKDQSYGLGKLKKVDKKIYIAGFEVNYQIYNEKQNFKQGGYVMGGGQRGDAQVEVSIGLEGLDEQTVIAITDKLYADYINKLKADGFTIITADEAGKTDTYSDFVRVQGGKVSLAQIPGTMNSTPTGYEYYIKKVARDGKEKTGGFLGNQAIMFPKLSKELDDAIIGNVDITVLFVQDQQAFQGQGAKLKVKTDLRVIGTEGITMTSDAKVKMKGQNTITTVSSTVAFYHGKVGAGSTTTYSGTLAKALEINDVVDETTVKSYAAGSTSFGTKSMYYTYYNVSNGNSANAKVISVDPAKYSEGVYAGTSKFLNFHVDEFLKSMD
jgi:hypothetical protein